MNKFKIYKLQFGEKMELFEYLKKCVYENKLLLTFHDINCWISEFNIVIKLLYSSRDSQHFCFKHHDYHKAFELINEYIEKKK